MEWNVVLSHELEVVDFDIVLWLPPLSPFLRVSAGDWNVSENRIEPHVKHFVLKSLQRHWHSPLQVTGDATRFQAFFQPSFRDDARIVRPMGWHQIQVFTQLPLGLKELIRRDFKKLQKQIGMKGKSSFGSSKGNHCVENYLWQIQENLLRSPDDRRCAAQLTPRTNQFDCVDELSTGVALVTSSIFKATAGVGTRSFDESVGQVSITFLAEQLIHWLLLHVSVGVNFFEEFLDNSGNGNGREGISYCSETEWECTETVRVIRMKRVDRRSPRITDTESEKKI